MKISGESAVPAQRRPSRPLLRAFNWYGAWYLGLHFRSLRIAHAERLSEDVKNQQPLPTIIFLSHASWWDPLVCIRIARRLLPAGEHYAPMEASSLARYRFFGKIGMFPVVMGSTRGALSFLHTAQEIMRSPNSVLWITPQGRFTDVRRPVELMRGLGALVRRLPRCRLIPLAIEYTFWDERLPEVLCNFGVPIEVGDGRERSADQWTQELASTLQVTLEELAGFAQTRDPKNFQVFASRTVGVGGIYQAWLHARARLRGEDFRPEHGSIGDR
ncbi:MAG TPA: lysophospholipid acyltransferase family protein [Acidobacteriaceae bacterium]|nr:lysophospholipid acyltransferase family protein [Acidobacteriaceae bacterium]